MTTTATDDLHAITEWEKLATEHDTQLCQMYDEIGFQKLANERRIDIQADPGGLGEHTYRKDDGTIKTVKTYHEPERDEPVDRVARLMDHVRGTLHLFDIGWVAADGTWLEPEAPPTMTEVRKMMRRGHGRKPITPAMQRAELEAFVTLSREWLARADRNDMRLRDARIHCELDINSAEAKLRQMPTS